MKIVVLAGGLSPERNVSLSTGTMVTEALRGQGHRAALVDLYFGLEDDAGALEELFDADVSAAAKRISRQAPDLEQVKANIATFQMGVPLSSREMDRLLAQAQRMVSKTALPCTACHYCVSHCPQGLDIPSLLALYNEHAFTGGGFLAPMALSALPQDKWPSACIGCRSCEAVCPQQLKISEAMADFASRL